MTRIGIDYAGGRPGGQAIRDAGYDFVVRYLSDGGPGLPGKQLLPAEADDLRAHRVSIVANWESWDDRSTDGYDAGVADAQAAVAQCNACHWPGNRPIYFSVDYDAPESDQPAINEYFKGAGAVLGGPQLVGVYGGFWPLSRLLDAGLVGWAWQTDAWSGTNIDTRRQMHQRVGFVNVNGVQCDVDEAFVDDFGQWDHNPGPPPFQYPDNDTMIRETWEQMRGLKGQGWPQLGKNPTGQDLSMVDAIAAIKTKAGA